MHLSFPQVPRLDDPDGQAWIFDTLSKKPVIQKLFCMMTGSVVTSGKAPKGKSKAKSKAAPKGGKKVAKAKAKSAAAAEGQAAPQLPAEADMQSNTVVVKRGVRNKLWVDDALRACNHVIKSLRSMPLFQAIPEASFRAAKRQLIRHSLLFALKGEFLLQTAKGGKLHKRWSTLRPALQKHGAQFLVQA